MALNIDAIWAKRVAKAILLVRVLVGWVFLSERIQKLQICFAGTKAD